MNRDKETRDRSTGSNDASFETIARSAVPTGRKGKHHEIIEKILREVGDLKAKRALRIPRSELGGFKTENIRAALSRASTKIGVTLATSADDNYFYVWRED
jgi:hypothetical protein